MASPLQQTEFRSRLSSLALAFATIDYEDYTGCEAFIKHNPAILSEKKSEFPEEAAAAAIAGRYMYAKCCVQQTLVLADCENLNSEEQKDYFAGLITKEEQAIQNFLFTFDEHWTPLLSGVQARCQRPEAQVPEPVSAPGGISSANLPQRYGSGVEGNSGFATSQELATSNPPVRAGVHDRRHLISTPMSVSTEPSSQSRHNGEAVATDGVAAKKSMASRLLRHGSTKPGKDRTSDAATGFGDQDDTFKVFNSASGLTATVRKEKVAVKNKWKKLTKNQKNDEDEEHQRPRTHQSGQEETLRHGQTVSSSLHTRLPSYPAAFLQASDPDVTARFQDLYNKLRTWSTDFARERRLEDVGPALLDAIRTLDPEVRTNDEAVLLLREPRSRRQIVESIVGSTIYQRMFDQRNEAATHVLDLWMPTELAKSVHAIESALRKTDKYIAPADFHHWRALSITLLSRTDDESTKKDLTQKYAFQVAEKILPYFEAWYPLQDLAYLRDGLENLVKASILVSALLRRQLAYWFVSYGADAKDSKIFDMETMLDVDAALDPHVGDESSATETSQSVPSQGPAQVTQQPAVRLKIFPGLFKCGNADGLKYDHEQCYLKMKVTCKKTT